MNNKKRIAFLGPTLPSAKSDSLIEVRPPVKQGDVLRALADGATHLGIVDGYFDQVPSVWHKEILFALESGCVVYGASSMGALRAAELHPFGMIGVGEVFERYARGELTDDDEVALVHGPESSGYRSISEAMVNLRDRLDAAVARGVITRAQGDEAATQLKALPYPARSMRALLALRPELAGGSGPSLKERDALLLLDRLRAAAEFGGRSVKVERSVFLERLRVEVMREKNDPDVDALAEQLNAVGDESVERLAAAFPRSRFVT